MTAEAVPHIGFPRVESDIFTPWVPRRHKGNQRSGKSTGRPKKTQPQNTRAQARGKVMSSPQSQFYTDAQIEEYIQASMKEDTSDA